MTTELCAYTCDACDIARRTGVTRIELCAAPFEGGTTPSAGLIRYARSLPGLRLSVMIRPRGGDFCYTDAETALMAEEIRFARACGADGVVLGVLTPDGEVDETRTAQLVREAEGMEVTFHRAFDMTPDLIDIPDDDYGVWYVDAMDHPDRWDGKKVHMKLIMCHSKKFPGIHCPGRFVMTCCENDIQFVGIVAKGDSLKAYKNRDWVDITATVKKEHLDAYEGEGPVLYVEKITTTSKPEQEVVSF